MDSTQTAEPSETSPFLPARSSNAPGSYSGGHTSGDSSNTPSSGQGLISANIRRRLYISHFLSTWNSRVFEFGAILFIASIFPGTLLPPSLYALVRSASAIFFSPAVGRYIDRGNRLSVVRVSIGMSHSPGFRYARLG